MSEEEKKIDNLSNLFSVELNNSKKYKSNQIEENTKNKDKIDTSDKRNRISQVRKINRNLNGNKVK